VLSLFLPLIISSGGNSGSQASTLVIRAMALGEVRVADWLRVFRREIQMGIVLGAILGSVAAVRVIVWGAAGAYSGSAGAHFVLVGCTVAASLVGCVLWGTLMGAMLPFALRKLGADPASASAPLVATLVDVSGIIIYFTIASVILTGTVIRSVPDACKLASTAEVHATFGDTFEREPDSPQTTDKSSRCVWRAGGTTLFVRSESIPKTSFEGLMESFSATVKPISGLGESAFDTNGALFAYKGDTAISIGVSGGDTEKLAPAQKTLMTKILTKL
jgi:cation transporter-like permease